MFDLPLQTQPETQKTGLPPSFLTVLANQDLPFALTTACHAPAALMSGQAHPKVLERFATLAEAMQGAVVHAENVTPEDAPRILAILDREGRLVLAGATYDGGVAWCHPVSDAAEARAVVSEASQTRAQAMRAAEWHEHGLARRLRHHADFLDARLVDPLWRVFASRALQIAALRPANKERLFDGLTAAGITHVTVSFDGYGDSGQVESIEAYAGDTEVAFPKTEIAYAALTWDDPEVEMRALSLEDVVEQLAYNFLSDTHGGWENNDGAYGEFCFDASARTIHLEFNERFTSSELYTHDF